MRWKHRRHHNLSCESQDRFRRKDGYCMKSEKSQKEFLVEELAEKYRTLLISTANALWEFHEPAYEEERSCALLKQILAEHGFSVSVPCREIPTAFTASFGKGKPVIGLLGEYDALVGLNQAADETRQRCSEGESPDTPGHGCGHNLLGTGLLGAALFLKEMLESHHLPGTIVYFGCPAEENASGKSNMIEHGFFEGVDAAFSWHPHAQAGIFNQSLANQRVVYTFHGTSAHASQAPHLGRSALDACELMNIGVNYLREHMIDEARIHYAYLDAGGKLPNIVPARAELLYAIRAPKGSQAQELRERTDRIARGAALMTDTTVEIKTKCIYDSIMKNATLDELLLKYMDVFLPIQYSEEELEYARGFLPYGNQSDSGIPIQSTPDLAPVRKTGISTDVGNVSQILPCSAFMVNCYANGSPLHHWTVTAQGKSSIAHKGMLAASKILASGIWEIFTNPEILEKAKQDFWKEKQKE